MLIPLWALKAPHQLAMLTSSMLTCYIIFHQKCFWQNYLDLYQQNLNASKTPNCIQSWRFKVSTIFQPLCSVQSTESRHYNSLKLSHFNEFQDVFYVYKIKVWNVSTTSEKCMILHCIFICRWEKKTCLSLLSVSSQLLICQNQLRWFSPGCQLKLPAELLNNFDKAKGM